MSLSRGAFVQLQVIHALILRETRTRFGKSQLGFVWALLEPLFWIAPFYWMYWHMGRSAPPGMTLLNFLVTGFVPYQLFTNTMNKVSAAVQANKGLLFYPQVRPLDLMWSRVFLEASTGGLVFCILMGAEAMVSGDISIETPLMVIGGFVGASLLGAGVGMILSVLSLYISTMDLIMGVLTRPLFWTSGLFFTANDMPLRARELLAYNPVLHCTEMVRHGWFTAYHSLCVDPPYLYAWGVVLLFLGLVFERASRARIQLS